jgi:hypothetical protein
LIEGQDHHHVVVVAVVDIVRDLATARWLRFVRRLHHAIVLALRVVFVGRTIERDDHASALFHPSPTFRAHANR